LLAAGVGGVWLSLLLSAGVVADEDGAGRSEQPVATLFGQPLHLDDSQAPLHAQPSDPAALDAQTSTRTRQLDQIRQKIWEALSGAFCATHDCEPTEADYAAFEHGRRRLRAVYPPSRQPDPAVPPEEYQRLSRQLEAELQADEEFLKSSRLSHPFEKPWWLMEPPAAASEVR